MSEEQTPDSEAPIDGAAKSGGGGGAVKVVAVLAVLNLAVTGFVVMSVMKLGHAMAAIGKEETKDEHAGPAPVASLDPFVVNLNEPGSSRYLKATVEIQVKNQKAADELNEQKRAVRDEVLRYLSGLTVADTLGDEGKGKIKHAIASRIDHHIGAERVKDVYLTEFVIQ